jgi:hypothetical protein
MRQANKGIRTFLKTKIPVRFWGILRFFDKYVIYILYCWYLIRRIRYQRSNCDAISSSQQFTFSFESDIIRYPYKNSKLSDILGNLGFQFSEGRHSIYIYRQTDIQKVSPALIDFYPTVFGLKIIKSQEISFDGTPYYTSNKLAKATNRISMRAVGSMKEKAFISNLLNLHGAAPKVYDIIKLVFGDQIYFAFVVQHVQGYAVTGEDGITFINYLNRVLDKTGIEVLGIKEHCDFRPPEFRHNIISDMSGVYYVDIQNFVMFDKMYHKHLAKRWQTVIAKDKKRFYPKQFFSLIYPNSVKNKNEEPPDYFAELNHFLEQYRINLNKYKVLDIGCNLGYFIMFALNQGARWCVGIDTEEMVDTGRQLLYQSGFTRFDMLGWHSRKLYLSTSAPFANYDLLHYFSTGGSFQLLEEFKKSRFKILLYEGQPHENINDMVSQIELWPLKVDIIGHCKLKSGKDEVIPIILGNTQ